MGGFRGERRLFTLCGLAVLALFLWGLKGLTADLVTTPACIYGCDYHHEMGVLRDTLRHPAATWQSSSHDWLGMANNYPKGASYLRLAFAALLPDGGGEPWRLVVDGSYAMLTLGFLGWVFFFWKVFDNGLLAVLLATAAVNAPAAPYFKYSSAVHVLLPFLLLSMLGLGRAQNRRIPSRAGYVVAAALLSALFSHLHATAFFLTYLYLFTIPVLVRRRQGEGGWGAVIPDIAVAGAGSLALSMAAGWWYRVLFVFGGADPSTPFSDQPSLLAGGELYNFTKELLQKTFLDFSDPSAALLTLALWVGGVLLVTGRTREGTARPAAWLAAVFGLSVFSHLVTVPLTGRHISPRHALAFQIHLMRAIMLGVLLTSPLLGALWSAWPRRLLLPALTALVAVFSVSAMLERGEERFWQTGKSAPPAHYRALNSWFDTRGADPGAAVLLSSNELSFAIHGFTGVRLWTGRNAHFYLFDQVVSGFQELWMDAALLLYGDDGQVREKILHSYEDRAAAQGKTLYLYWNSEWVDTEWITGRSGLRPFDPLRFEHTAERARRLEEAGVTFNVVKQAVFEPSVEPGPHTPRMDLIYIAPANYRSRERPWKSGLDPYLEEVWAYEQDGRVEARLFKMSTGRAES